MPMISASTGESAAGPGGGFVGSGITDLNVYYSAGYLYGLAVIDAENGIVNVSRDGTAIADPSFSSGKYFYEVEYVSGNAYHSVGWAVNPTDFSAKNPSLVVYMYDVLPGLYNPKLFTIDIGPSTTTMRCFGRQTDNSIVEIGGCLGCTFSHGTSTPYHPATAVYRASSGGAFLDVRYDPSQMTMLDDPALAFLSAEGFQPVSNFYV